MRSASIGRMQRAAVGARSPRAARAGRGCARRRSRRRASDAAAASRTKAGVGSSLSPNQNASTSSRPSAGVGDLADLRARASAAMAGSHGRLLKTARAAARWCWHRRHRPAGSSARRSDHVPRSRRPVIRLRSCAASTVCSTTSSRSSAAATAASRRASLRSTSPRPTRTTPSRSTCPASPRTRCRCRSTAASSSVEARAASRRREEGRRPHRLPRAFGCRSFARSFKLPVELDQAASSAKLDNGVLTLTLAKRGAERRRATDRSTDARQTAASAQRGRTSKA